MSPDSTSTLRFRYRVPPTEPTLRTYAEHLTSSATPATSHAASHSRAKRAQATLNRIDIQATEWMANHAVQLLRISLGIVFLWFGALKFFPGLSPAEGLVMRTMDVLTFGLIPAQTACIILAAWECLIGLGLITGRYLRATLILLGLQMIGTFTPLLFFPGETFTHFPYALTMEGQYIIKNIVLISAGIAIGATVRGGTLVATQQNNPTDSDSFWLNEQRRQSAVSKPMQPS